MPLNLPPLLASLLIQIGVKRVFRSLLSVAGSRIKVKAELMIQEIKEIIEDTLRKKVVMVIMGRGMENSVLMAL